MEGVRGHPEVVLSIEEESFSGTPCVFLNTDVCLTFYFFFHLYTHFSFFLFDHPSVWVD